MPSNELLLLLDVALNEKLEFDTDAEDGDIEVDEEYLERLRFFFDDDLILAALDLVERDSVIKLNTPWGHSRYQVIGTTATYSVFPGQVVNSKRTPPYCTCASFVFSVLVTDAQYMCKHLLGVALALRLKRCLERSATPDDIAQICSRPVI